MHIAAREKTQVGHQCGAQQDGLTQGKQAILARVQVGESVSYDGQRSKCGPRGAKCSTNELGLQLESSKDLLRDDKKALVYMLRVRVGVLGPLFLRGRTKEGIERPLVDV